MQEPEQQLPQFPRIERVGSSIAHASALVVGLPVSIFLLALPWSLLFSPVLSYMIGRSFRRRGMTWGAYQGIQASVMQLLILFMAIMAFVTSGIQTLSGLFGLVGFLLFIYSLWGALDSGMGEDFQYIGIRRLLEKVSRRNMERQEVRHRWLKVDPTDRDSRGDL